MRQGSLSSLSCLGCVVVFLIPTIYGADICSSGTTRGTWLTITRSGSHDYTQRNCECYIHNPGEMEMKLNLHFEPTERDCDERFEIRTISVLYERCSNVENVTRVTNEDVFTRTKQSNFSILYSGNVKLENGRTRYLNLTVKALGQKTNINVFCNLNKTIAAPTNETTPVATTEFKLITPNASATITVSEPSAIPTPNKANVTTARPKSGVRSRAPSSMPRSVAITSPKDEQSSNGPTTEKTRIRIGSPGETKRSVVRIQTFLIVVVVLSIVIFAFIIGAGVFFCRRKTPRRKTDETETPVIYAEPDRSNRLPRPRSKPDESAYAASSDVSIEIPVPPKSWEVEGQIPRHSVLVENVVYDSQND